MKRIFLSLVMMILFLPKLVWAACTEIIPAKNDTFPLQGVNITVGNDIPLGSVIYRQAIHSYHSDSAPHLKCDGLNSPPYTENQYGYITHAPLSLSSWQQGRYAGYIYKTNNPGVGVVITNKGEENAYGFTPRRFYSRTTQDSVENVQLWNDVKLLLIKTGTIQPGIINGDTLPSVEYQDTYLDQTGKKVIDYKPYKFSFGGSLNIVSKTCKVKDFSVNLGAWDISNLKKLGHSEWRRADIRLDECPQFYGMVSGVTTDHITLENSGLTRKKNTLGLVLHPISDSLNSQQGIMSIEKADNSATGVGIQIFYGDANGIDLPVEFDIERNIEIPEDGGSTVIIPLRARYVQTEEKVTPGSANGHVIFTINYY